MVGVQRGAGPVELVPVEGDGLVQDLTGAPADDPRGQTGNSRFREQLDLNTGCHEAGETERFVGRELAMPETAYDTVPRRNAFRAETIDHKRARRWENQSRRAEKTSTDIATRCNSLQEMNRPLGAFSAKSP